ncbi:hypothetical protein NEMIN01_1644 [Nematocida minor]|uniref:uncharacterized protein n=1 Tax=Nematocida minor TaxID=1912983 RepID=UPI00221FC8D3|nr:uncharacterized protein NEMIN01_1644 [Nematocida minor]KAI5191753.1 hypothetical protein NEMIN01_1644 [Nematocida minor]
MDDTQNGREYRRGAKNSPNVKKRKAAKVASNKYLPDYEDSFEEWEQQDSRMIPFNILAKCAAKELKQLKRKKPEKENREQDSSEHASEGESEIMDIDFPCIVTGNKKIYRCTFHGCSKEFPSLSRMRRHYIIHTGAKPFKCLSAKCNKSFSRRDNMIQHYKGHCSHANTK